MNAPDGFQSARAFGPVPIPLLLAAALFLCPSSLPAPDANHDGLDDLWAHTYAVVPFSGAANPDGDPRINLVESLNFSDPNTPDPGLGLVVLQDANGDGMDDFWQLLHNISADDALADTDGDGRTALEESYVWSDPHQADIPGCGPLGGGGSAAAAPAGPTGLALGIQTRPGSFYVLEMSSNQERWFPVPAVGGWWGDGRRREFEVEAGGEMALFRFRVESDADSDGDGLSGWHEAMVFGTSDGSRDSDGDGMEDGMEVRSGLNPNDSGSGNPDEAPEGDKDHDGLSNAEEMQTGTRSDNADTDGDGVGDGEDGWALCDKLAPARLVVPSFAVIQIGPAESAGKFVNNAGQAVYAMGHTNWFWQARANPVRIECGGTNLPAAALNNAGRVLASVTDTKGMARPMLWSQNSPFDLVYMVEAPRRSNELAAVFPMPGELNGLVEGEVPEPMPLPTDNDDGIEFHMWVTFSYFGSAAGTALNDAGRVVGAEWHTITVWQDLWGAEPGATVFHTWGSDGSLGGSAGFGVIWAPSGEAQRLGDEFCNWDYRLWEERPENAGKKIVSPGGINNQGIIIGTFDQYGEDDFVPDQDDVGMWMKESGDIQQLGEIPSALNNRNHILGAPTNRVGAVWWLDLYAGLRNNNSVTGTPNYQRLDWNNTMGNIPPMGALNDRMQVLSGNTLWHNARNYDLARLTPSTQGTNAVWRNLTGADINDNGVIVGTATKIADGKQHAVLLLPFDMAVDSNRDGFIKFAGNYDDSSVTGKPYDKTEETKPFAFWLNDDDDRNDKDAVDSSHKDSDDGTINSRRDLEDFSRLNIFVGGLHEAITAGQIKVGLKWKNTGSTSPRVKVWRNKSPNGGSEYLTDDDVAQEHMTLGNPGDVQGATPYIIPTQFWTDSSLSESQPNGYLLFEAVSEGKGQLCITLHKEDGSEIGEGPGVWLDLKNVKKMYVRAKGTPENGIDAPFESYFSQPNPPPTGYVNDPNGHPFQQPHDEADSLIVLVHGIHAPFTASPDAYKGNIVAAEIVFKRLWHQGFKGRFAFYKWPALNPAGFGSTGFRFNESEYRAWKYGRGLALFVNSINKSSKNLFSHSQGNIVCGAALTDYGLSVDNYVLTQAAVPAGCYDTSGGQSDPTSINGYARFWNKEASKPTPDFASDIGYRGYLQNLSVSGNVRNFHNFDDYALASGRTLLFLETHWEANQDSYKPDDSLSNQNYYTYLPANPPGQRGYLGDAFFVGRFVTDPYESMSMIARPRSKAVGALGATRGRIGGDYDLSALQGSSGQQVVTSSSDDHGAQVGRRIQEVWPYYTELGRTFGVIPLPE